MPATTIRPLFTQIDDWLQDCESTKTAAAKPSKSSTKKAAPSGMGETSHPSEKVDDGTQDEETGARYEENSKDVKKDIPGASVDATDPKSGGTQDDKQFNIGTVESATGEDPSVEDDYKGSKDDPGTSHPMNAEDTGTKYSSMSFKQLAKLATDKANSLLADFASDVDTKGQTVSQKVAAVKAAQAANTVPPQQAAKTGYDTAVVNSDLEKIAADFIAQTIRDANLDADLVGSFLHSYHASQKKAADEGAEGESHDPPKPEDSQSDPAAPGADAAPGGGGDALSALGAAAPPPDMAGLGGAGGPPGAGGGDQGAGGAMDKDQAIQELTMALQELGLSPEQFAQMAQVAAAGGGAAGGPPGGGGGMPPGPMGPDAGGAPPMPPDGAAEGMKLAALAKQHQRSGKFRFTEAKTAAQRQVREQIKNYVRDLIGLNN